MTGTVTGGGRVHAPAARVIAPRTDVSRAGDYAIPPRQSFFAPALCETRTREVVCEVLPGFARSPYIAPVRIRAPAHAEISRGTLGREIDTTDSRHAADRAVGAGATKIVHDPCERRLVDELKPTAAQALFERRAAVGFWNGVVAAGRAPLWESLRVAAAVVDFTEQSAGWNADAFGGECVVPTELRFCERIFAIQRTGCEAVASARGRGTGRASCAAGVGAAHLTPRTYRANRAATRQITSPRRLRAGPARRTRCRRLRCSAPCRCSASA